MSSHRRDVRPRYGRIAVLATSVTVSAVAALAGIGVLATSQSSAGALGKPASYTSAPPEAATPDPATASPDATQGQADDQPATKQGANVSGGTSASGVVDANALPSD